MEDEGMKTKQAVNPYLPSWEYVPDAEPHIVDGRVYIYGSHDLFNGLNFCLGDYVCWSAPVDDLGNWRYEGVIFKREQDPAAPKIRLTNGLAAPDMIQGPDGRFYLYYFMGGTKMISVAVCDKPAGKYEFYGYVKYADGTPIGKKEEPLQFDPGVFMDDDGKLYLYTGFALQGNPLLLDGSKPTEHGAMCFELDPADMLTVKMGPKYIGIASEKEAPGSSYEGHPFLEASSMRKFNGTYYFIYSSLNSHELCYATSDNPTEGFEFGGVLVSNGDIGLPGITDVKNARNCTGNTHGSLIEINGSYYVFYHRHSNRKQSSRQACAERIRFENGKFYQAEITSCGLNDSLFYQLLCLTGAHVIGICADGNIVLLIFTHDGGCAFVHRYGSDIAQRNLCTISRGYGQIIQIRQIIYAVRIIADNNVDFCAVQLILGCSGAGDGCTQRTGNRCGRNAILGCLCAVNRYLCFGNGIPCRALHVGKTVYLGKLINQLILHINQCCGIVAIYIHRHIGRCQRAHCGIRGYPPAAFRYRHRPPL